MASASSSETRVRPTSIRRCRRSASSVGHPYPAVRVFPGCLRGCAVGPPPGRRDAAPMFNQTSTRTAEDAVLNCQVCGQVMGTYEPMIVLSPEGGVREASLLQLEDLG